MERFYYEIVAAPDGKHHVPTIQAIIAHHPSLVAASEPWGGRAPPCQSDLYALVVVASDGLAADVGVRQKVAHASAGGFPVIPVVEDRATYEFHRAPLAELAERNAEAINDPERLVRSLLHHGGIELFEGGGHVFISYARADGSTLADAVRDALTHAGIGRTMDVHAFAGGDLIQEDIELRIGAADLVVLIDSCGASKSPWVAEELDIAMAAHVQAIAVTPAAGAFHHAFQVPHVAWAPRSDVAAEVVLAVRRVLARKLAFRARVCRILGRLARLRDWTVTEHGERWRLQPGRGKPLTIAYLPEAPGIEAVVALREAVTPGRGLLVAGVRPLRPLAEKGMSAAGGKQVSVTPLPSMASRIPGRIARRPLARRRVFLSAAMPSEPDDIELARVSLGRFVVGLCQALVELGATLVFGGHPSVTPLVHKAVVGILGPKGGRIELHQARLWKADTVSLKAEVREGPLFRQVKWHGAGKDAAEDVTALRDGMICDGLSAGVFVGGKTSGFIGSKPGIVDEFNRFTHACPGKPTFALGLAGGAARMLPSDGSMAGDVLKASADPDLAVALIVAELLGL